MEIFCFLAGILYTYTLNNYLFLIPFCCFFITPRPWIIIFFILGTATGWFHDWYVYPKGLPETQVIPIGLLEGTIASIPISTPGKSQFSFTIEQFNGHPAKGLVQLAWYNNPPSLYSGQRWQLSVKLKKPRNFVNPGSYNYVNSLKARHITWTGYVRNGKNKRLPKAHSLFHWLQLREHLASSLTKLAPDQQTAGVLEALTLNLTTHITQENWNLFRRTGTTHLFGISGEHIALVSGLFFWILRWLWSRNTRCCLYLPAISFASIGGLTIALVYSFLAGFGPPVQRALIGCFFYTIKCLGKQRLTQWQIWRYAMFGVLCLEPHAVFMQGFYFSFLAVACLLLTHQRWQLTGFKGTLALQLSCLIGLMPLTLYWFSYGSINGFIANLFAIPLVGFLIVPLALITMLCSSFSWSWILMKPLCWLVSLLFKGLELTEKLASINLTWSIHAIEFIFCLMGALLIWILLPVKPFKYIAVLWIIIPFFPPRTEVNHGEVLLQILDVGQGLAVNIQTKNHVLLYDTGDQFFQGSDLGKMVILPFYKLKQINKIDALVISHPDKDHRGGLNSIMSEMQVNQLMVNDPSFYHRGLNCHNYPEWHWDGVTFRFLPIKIAYNDKNNTSCILQVSNTTGKILLTGDIEKKAEDYLVKTYGNQLESEILIVPHHGSNTSSSYRFLLEVAPRYAIASLGFDNRFHFPHAKTLHSMKNLDIPFIRTDECGMVEVKFPLKGEIIKPVCFSNR